MRTLAWTSRGRRLRGRRGRGGETRRGDSKLFSPSEAPPPLFSSLPLFSSSPSSSNGEVEMEGMKAWEDKIFTSSALFPWFHPYFLLLLWTGEKEILRRGWVRSQGCKVAPTSPYKYQPFPLFTRLTDLFPPPSPMFKWLREKNWSSSDHILKRELSPQKRQSLLFDANEVKIKIHSLQPQCSAISFPCDVSL